MKVLIAVPTTRDVETECMKSIYDLDLPEGVTTTLDFFYGYDVSQVRNLIMFNTVDNEYDYVLCVDADMVLPRNALTKLLDLNTGVATGVYRQKNLDANIPELYGTLDNGDITNIDSDWLIEQEEPFEVTAAGFGCMLIHKDVLNAMTYPHVYYKHSIDFKDTESEDVFFCKKAKEAGYPTYCDPTVQCGHVGKITYYFKS